LKLQKKQFQNMVKVEEDEENEDEESEED